MSSHGSSLAFAACCDLKRRRDRGFGSDRSETKTLTQYDYEDMNTGIEFEIDYRYAGLLTWLFVVMIYGTGLPILYPIGALNFFVGYWVDKYLILNHYRSSPMFGHHILLQVLDWFKWALLCHFVISCWIFGNQKLLPSKNNNAYTTYAVIASFIVFCWTVYRVICRPCKNFCKRVYAKHEVASMVMAEDAVEDFYEKCSY
jgi:hypothetical protein